MYDLLYKYEHKIKNTTSQNLVKITGLKNFWQTNDIYINTINKTNEVEANKYKGYFLFKQANDATSDYWIVRHLRNAIAHGFVKSDKKLGVITFKDGERKIKGLIPKELLLPMFDILNKAC